MVIESLKLHLSTCIQLLMTKHPSRKVMNFRHLLGCDTFIITSVGIAHRPNEIVVVPKLLAVSCFSVDGRSARPDPREIIGRDN